MSTVAPNSLQAWLLAARPKTLSGATVPVLIGIAMAYSHDGFSAPQAILCLLFAWLMQIDANLINDLYDYLKGSDREDRLGPERACSQGWITPQAMRMGIAVNTALAVCVGLGILYYGGWWMLPIGLACVLFAFLYTAGPYPLAYHGWGDAAVLVFFGLVPVGCTYYVQTGTYTTGVFMASLACGLVIDTLLMVNNYRDREQDRISGKRTLVVRFGKRVGWHMYVWLGAGACLCCLYFCFEGAYMAGLLPFVYLLPHGQTALRMRAIEGRALNSILAKTSMNILLFGVLLCIGLLLA